MSHFSWIRDGHEYDPIVLKLNFIDGLNVHITEAEARSFIERLKELLREQKKAKKRVKKEAP